MAGSSKTFKERAKERQKQNKTAEDEGKIYPRNSSAYEAQIRNPNTRQGATYRTNYVKDRGERLARLREEYRQKQNDPEYQKEMQELERKRKLGKDFKQKSKEANWQDVYMKYMKKK